MQGGIFYGKSDSINSKHLPVTSTSRKSAYVSKRKGELVSYPSKKLRSLDNHVVVFTGALPGMTQGKAKQCVARLGGTTRNRVTRDTSVLVRGDSSQWMYRDYGKKESRASDYISSGFEITVVDADQFLRLLENGKPALTSNFVAGTPMSELISLHDQAKLSSDSPIPAGDLDRWTLVKSRREQAILREQHLDGRNHARCAICGQDLPASLLRTSHLKRRSECSAKEKRDAANIVMLMCELGCDAMYEMGFFTINPKGRIIVTTNGVTTPALRKNLRALKGKTCAGYCEEREPYFQWHRTTVFLG